MTCSLTWQERKTCPNCNMVVRRADIRVLFSDHVAVVDNSGIEAMTQKWEDERSKRIQVWVMFLLRARCGHLIGSAIECRSKRSCRGPSCSYRSLQQSVTGIKRRRKRPSMRSSGSRSKSRA